VRKASHHGSKQQQRSCSQSLLLLLARAAYIMVLFFTHIPFNMNHTINATPPERLQNFKALRTSCLTLAFAPAEYCAPVWCGSAHTKHINVALNESMSVITGCLRRTPSSFLPILSGITPSETRRSAS